MLKGKQKDLGLRVKTNEFFINFPIQFRRSVIPKNLRLLTKEIQH